MKLHYLIPVLFLLMGASCSKTKPESVSYPLNTLVECPELQEIVMEADATGITLGEFYLHEGKVIKQYADCATIHNELVRFIKKQQKKKTDE